MNNRIELIVNSTGNTITRGTVDLYPDEPINIKMSVASIFDITQSSGSFSKTFTVPGTANNNLLFGHIFAIGSDSVFDPRKSTRAYLMSDTIPVFQNGNLQLTKVKVSDQKKIEYDINVFDEAISLVEAIGTKELTDLDFSDLNHVWSGQAIFNSWTADTDYYYGLIDYGYDFSISTMNSGNGVQVKQMLPGIKLKRYTDAILSGAGFNYSSSLFSGNYYDDLIVPFVGSTNIVNSTAFTHDRNFLAHISSPSGFTVFTNLAGAPQIGPFPILFDNTVSAGGFDNGGLFNQAPFLYSYSSNTYSIQQFSMVLDWNSVVGARTMASDIFVTLIREYNGTPFTVDTQEFKTDPYTGGYTATTQFTFSPLNQTSGLHQYARPGEKFYVSLRIATLNYGSPVGNISYNINTGNTFFYNHTASDAVPGQLLDMNQLIPKKIRQIDLLNSVLLMHNCYVEPSKTNSKTLIIEPRSRYYAGGTQRDWTNKLDLSIPVEEKICSEVQAHRYIFTYKDDSDWYNTQYKKERARTFGDFYYNVDNDYVKGDKVIPIIFSPTPSVAVGNSSIISSNGNPNNIFVIPKIGQQDSNNNFGATDFNIRVLQRNNANLISLPTSDYWKLDGHVMSSYPYLGHVDHPYLGSTDINFGTTEYENYIVASVTSNNLVNAWWKTYLDQISDKNAKIITANFYLKESDIQSFRFADQIFVDGLTSDGGAYFVVNSIDYSPTSNGTSKVELVKLPNKFVNTDASVAIANIAETTNLQSLVLGGAVVGSTSSIGLGQGSIIGTASDGSFVLGPDNLVNGGSPRSMILGSGNTIDAGLKNVFILGDNVTGATSDMMYIPSLTIAPGGSINNIPISGLTLFSGSSGSNSIIANNGTGNVAGGTNTVVLAAAGLTGNNANTLYVDNINITHSATTDVMVATTLSAGTMISGSTNLYDIFLQGPLTHVQPGLNTYTGGTASNPSINISGATLFYLSATSISATTFYSGSTDLGTLLGTSGVISIQNGLNTYTGGTVTNPSVNISGGTLSNLSAGTFSAGTINSGSTNLYQIFAPFGTSGVIAVQPGLNIITGGTQAFPIVSTVQNPTFVSLSATSISATTFYSGSTNLDLLISGVITNVQNGLNTYTGGTSSNPSVNISAATLSSLIVTGATILNILTANTISATTFYSGSTDLSNIFEHSFIWSRGAGAQSVILNNLTSNTAPGVESLSSGRISIARGAGSHSEGNQTVAHGADSHAEGYQTISSGISSHAEGFQTKTIGNSSHAEGSSTTSSGNSSHAEGLTTVANGDYSHAEGSSTQSNGLFSHAEGSASIANGQASHAEGFNNMTIGITSHAGGESNIAQGRSSFAHGSGNTAQGDYSVVFGTGSTAQGTSTSVFGNGIIGTNDDTLYCNNLNVGGTDWSAATSGSTVWLIGGGVASVFLNNGSGNISSGIASYTEGSGNTSSANFAHAEGILSVASGNSAHAEGQVTIAGGVASHAEGSNTFAMGIFSHAEGQNTTAIGIRSHAQGVGTIASAATSHAEGNGTLASGDTSHAEGLATVAGGFASHAEGNNTFAIGDYSHSEGHNNTASGIRSHVQNISNTASGDGSDAGGFSNLASGAYSFVRGSGSTASANSAIVLGNDITGNIPNTVFAPSLELSSTIGYLLLNRLTSAQETALTPQNGMIIYNTTLNKFRGYENGAWANLI